jgi:C1A family cysteine protease
MSNTVAYKGIVQMPATNPVTGIITDTLEGGHCVLLVGFNDATQMFTCLNSWGPSWGNNGYFYMPYAYILDKTLTSDLCILNFIY